MSFKLISTCESFILCGLDCDTDGSIDFVLISILDADNLARTLAVDILEPVVCNVVFLS